MVRILHLADLHLGWTPPIAGGRGLTRRDERDGVLAQAVDCALKAGVDLVVIAGDLFDSHHPAGRLVDATIQRLARLTAAGIALVTVPGCHDEIAYPDGVYRRRAADWPGVLVTGTRMAAVTRLDVRGQAVHVHAMAHASGAQDTPDLPSVDGLSGLHVAVLHTRPDATPTERVRPISTDAMARAGYHYVALGHSHQYAEYAIGRGLAVDCGVADALDLDLPGTGFLTVAELATGDGPAAARTTIHHVPLAVRAARTIVLDVSSLASPSAVAAAIEECRDPAAMVRVKLSGTTRQPIDRDALCARLAHQFWHLEVEDDTRAPAPAAAERLVEEPGVRGQFVRRLRARLASADATRPALLEDALRAGLLALGEGESQ